MAASILGVQPLKFGTTVMSGYVVESYGDDTTTQELLIENEIGDIITQIGNFGIKTDVTIEVIPLTGTAVPAVFDVFAYGDKTINILSLAVKRMKKDVEKWIIKGNRFPAVTPG